MEFKVRIRRRGADPSKKDELGMTGVSSRDQSYRYVNFGNGICMAAKIFSNCQATRCKLTLYIRLLCPSAAMTLSVPDDDKAILPTMMKGKAGQTSSKSFAGVSGVQKSCRFR